MWVQNACRSPESLLNEPGYALFTPKKGPVLRIGHHRLEGKLVQLPQPLAVIRKRDDPEDEDDELEENGMDSEDAHMAQVRRRRRAAIGGLVGFTSSAPPSSNAITAPTSPSKEAERRGTQVDYDVLTIIRYKYHFKNRPEISVSEAHRGANQLIDKRPKAV